MGIEDITNQAKDMAAEHAEKAAGVVDQVAEKVKNVAPDQADGLVDKAADAAKGVLGQQ